MTDDQRQLALFESLSPRSNGDTPSSLASSTPETSSSAPETSTKDAATRIDSIRRAAARSQRAGAGAAVTSKPDAKATEDLELPFMHSISTAARTERRLLELPRPKTREDCRNEARPCPWVGCRHHLLIDIAMARPRAHGPARATAMRMITSTSSGGRRPGLRSSAAADLVRAWIDEAVEMLARLEYTCALDVVEQHPGGLSMRGIARALWVTKQQARDEVRAIVSRLKERPGLVEHADE